MTQSPFSPGYKRYALAVMTSVYMLNLIDRGMVSLMLQPIKQDLDLTDTQIGFLTGIAFGLFYATAGLPIARWADRGNRATIVASAIGLWGLTVMGCVLVTNFAHFVVARIAAAVGEAGCKPPTYSMVGDYFPDPTERARAMSIYIAGAPLPALVSFIVAGWLNELYGWRMTFLLMGIPGLVLAVIVKLTIVEPRTRLAPTLVQKPVVPMRAVLTLLWRQRTSRHLAIALILVYLLGMGLNPWYAAFMMRSHGMGTGELGTWLGLIFGLGGIAGVLAGGVVAGRWFASNERGQLRMSAVTVTMLLPCFVAFLTLPGKYAALAALIPLILMFNFFMGPTYALMQRLVPDDMRATMLAVVMLLANLIGFGLGPQAVGIASDALTPRFGGDALRYAMLTMAFVALWAGFHFWRAGHTVSADLALRGRT